MNVFIDTQIFLNFFDFSNEDLEELRKIVVLTGAGKIRLLLPQQVIDEFDRNRANKIEKALKEFSQPDFKAFPQMIKSYPEYAELETAKREFAAAKKKILAQLDLDKRKGCLKADEVIKQIFDSSECIDVTETVLKLAMARKFKGNPPGKKSETIGDQINWESILQLFPKKETPLNRDPSRNDLHVITSDSDWASEFDKERPKSFLASEWEKHANGRLFLYTQISTFTLKHFPEIDLASELEKELAVRDFVDSGSYSGTHETISRLSGIDQFSKPQTEAILDAYISNDQINAIILDDDVLQLLTDIVTKHSEWISHHRAEALVEILKGRSVKNEDKEAKIKALRASLQLLSFPF